MRYTFSSVDRLLQTISRELGGGGSRDEGREVAEREGGGEGMERRRKVVEGNGSKCWLIAWPCSPCASCVVKWPVHDGVL